MYSSQALSVSCLSSAADIRQGIPKHQVKTMPAANLRPAVTIELGLMTFDHIFISHFLVRLAEHATSSVRFEIRIFLLLYL
jgi:hypothetical protein